MSDPEALDPGTESLRVERGEKRALGEAPPILGHEGREGLLQTSQEDLASGRAEEERLTDHPARADLLQLAEELIERLRGIVDPRDEGGDEGFDRQPRRGEAGDRLDPGSGRGSLQYKHNLME